MRANTWAVWLSCVGAVLLTACGAKIVGDGDAGGADSGTVDSGNVDSGPECRTGELLCDDVCVLVNESREHCGACDNACVAGEVCSAGTCATSCGGGLTDCDGVCRDLDTNRAHCGACGTACASGQVCVDGACELSCAEGQEICDGTCTDTSSSVAHCGVCGTACAAGQLCVDGACELSCAEGQVICDGSCADTNSSFENCGSCGNACSDGQVCSLGTCALSCASGLTDCSGACVELPYNVNHCTACDAACGPYANAIPSCNNTCIMTCNAGFEDCNADRVDGCEVELATDELHCGECGVACSFANAATECVAGACVMGACNAGFDDCDGVPANGCECRIAVVGPPGTSPFSGGTIRDLDEDPATGAITPSGMVTDTSRDFLWVVNVNESTVSRWDANLRMEVARYRVGLPAGECAGSCCHNNGCNMPSRVVVDGNGDAYVANRAFGMQGTVVKIAGDVSECVDRNANGMIDTSTSATPMAWGEDECILWTANVGAVNAVLRSITSDRGDAMRPNGYIWVGSYNLSRFYRLDPNTGATLNEVAVGFAPYGAVPTSDGKIWVTALGAQVQSIDTTTFATSPVVNLPFSIYGPTADANGRLWFSGWSNYIAGYDPATGMTTRINLRASQSSAGVTVDASGNVWIGLNEGATRSTLVRMPTSAFTPGTATNTPGIIPADQLTYFDGPANPTSAIPTAVGVDRAGSVWLASYTGNSRLLRLDPAMATFEEFTGPNRTYSYSDFTGSVRRASIPQGSYEQIFDLACANPVLGQLRIDGTFPDETISTISMRTADTVANLGSATDVAIGTLPPSASPYAIGTAFADAAVTPQQQLRVRVVLRASPGGAVPILNGIRMSWTCP